jgi:hypothetical protein
LNSERDFFSKGLAVGGMDITTQVARWRFRAEEYETTAVVFWAIKDYDCRFPVAKIEAVRKLGVRVR